MTLARRHITAVAAVAVLALAAGACGADDVVPNDSVPTRQPRGHLPETPARSDVPASPALLDTIGSYVQPRGQASADWQLAIGRLGSHRLTYRAPIEWEVDGRGRASSGSGIVRAIPTYTPLVEGREVTMPQYLDTLASGNAITSYVTGNGYTVYVVTREVSPAPTDPEVETVIFHTAVVSVGGRMAKLDITYPSKERWRFNDLCIAIMGTIEVQPPLRGGD